MNRKRIQVYKNLHKNCWSVRQAGKVILHTNFIVLSHCRFLVGQKGRERVLATGRKNVHATVSGYQSECLDFNIQEMRKATYSPYKYSSFVDYINELPIYTADMVVMDIDDGVFYQPTGR